MYTTKQQKPQQSRVIQNVSNNQVFTQFYRPEGVRNSFLQIIQKRNVIKALKQVQLKDNQYFHCTTKKGYKNIGNIKAILPKYGGTGGAGEAIGGKTGEYFQEIDKGYSFASKSPEVIAEYFELNLAKAIMNKDIGWIPVVLIVSDLSQSILDTNEDYAIKSSYGFAVDKRIYTGYI